MFRRHRQNKIRNGKNVKDDLKKKRDLKQRDTLEDGSSNCHKGGVGGSTVSGRTEKDGYGIPRQTSSFKFGKIGPKERIFLGEQDKKRMGQHNIKNEYDQCSTHFEELRHRGTGSLVIVWTTSSYRSTSSSCRASVSFQRRGLEESV